MYTRQELDAIDQEYFEVIIADEYDVILMSKKYSASLASSECGAARWRGNGNSA